MSDPRDHSRREEPRLGCDCRACQYAREDHIEEALKKLYTAELSFGTVPPTLPLPLVDREMRLYLRGDITYEAMKTALIEKLWKMTQDYYKADIDRARLAPMPMVVSGTPVADVGR